MTVTSGSGPASSCPISWPPPGSRHLTDCSTLQRDTARWYRGRGPRPPLLPPALLAAAGLATSPRLLDVATGPGEVVSGALSQIGPSGLVVGVDISVEMLHAARMRVQDRRFRSVVADGEGLRFTDGAFGSVVCQLGLMFFPDPARGLTEFHRVLRPQCRAAGCVISHGARAPMWA